MALTIFRLVVFLILSVQICGAVYAYPSSLKIRLFDAHGKPIHRVQIRGPLELVSRRTERFGGDQWISVAVENGILKLTGGNGRQILTCRNFVAVPRDSRGVTVQVHKKLERAYRGKLIFSLEESTSKSSGMAIVNEIPTYEYVASVVGSEAPPNSPPEALKAYAVLTTLIVERKKDGDFVGDSTKEQVYKGCVYATPSVVRAVKAAVGTRVLYRNSPIQAYFHSTCAGGTSTGEAIFGENGKGLKYLESVKCDYCKKSPFWRTKTQELPEAVVASIFGGKLPVITKLDSEKRPTEVTAGGAAMTGYEAWIKIGRAQGWGVIPGTRYEVKRFELSHQPYIQFSSTGAGHGVGLCQWGAYGLAESGKSYTDILKFYFPSCEVIEN